MAAGQPNESAAQAPVAAANAEIAAANAQVEAARPDVTIVVTSYNQGPFIAEAVASALAQTVPCRVVVVDDGSDDDSVQTASALGVEVVSLPHGGAIAAFRAGVARVATPFYCLLNADDVFEPTYVARTRPLLADPRVGFVYTGVRYIGTQSGVVAGRPFDAGALRFGNFAHASSLVRKAAYEAVGGFDAVFADHHEDWALWAAMVSTGWLGAGVDEPLLQYRKHAAPSRNPQRIRDRESARWRIARRHPRWYGVTGFARLGASSLKLLLTGG